MVRRAIERDAGRQYAAKRIGQRRARRIKDRVVIEACRAGCRRVAAFALPGVQRDMVMIATRREKRGLLAEALRQIKAQHIAVETERALDIGHFQMNVADPRARIDRIGRERLRRAVIVHRITLTA